MDFSAATTKLKELLEGLQGGEGQRQTQTPLQPMSTAPQVQQSFLQQAPVQASPFSPYNQQAAAALQHPPGMMYGHPPPLQPPMGAYGSNPRGGFACDNCGQAGHGVLMCPQPLDPDRVASKQIERAQMRANRDARQSQLNDIYVQKGFPGLVRQLPSQRWQDGPQRGGNAYAYQQAPPAPQSLVVPPASPAYCAPTLMGGPIAVPTPGPVAAQSSPLIADPSLEGVRVGSWMIEFGPWDLPPTSSGDIDKRMIPLVGFQAWEVPSPWKGAISILFDSFEHATAAAWLLAELHLRQGDGSLKPANVTSPVEVPTEFRNGKVSTIQVQGDTEMQPPGEASDHGTPKRGRDPDDGECDFPGAQRRRDEGATTEVDLQIAGLKKGHREHSAQIEALGKKIDETGDRVTSIAGNVTHMIRKQAVESWRKERGWHKIGKLDAAARKCLMQGSVKGKINKQKIYYFVDVRDEPERYHAQQGLVSDVDGRMVYWSPAKDPATQAAQDEDMDVCSSSIEWMFSDAEQAVRAVERLNGLLEQQEARVREELGEEGFRPS